MCFSYNAQPPTPPIRGGAADAERRTLQSADGATFAAFAARAEKPNGAGVVVMPDVRGLFPFYEELALRFAEQGINSVAIDYFGRTAGVAERGEDFPFMEYVEQTKAPEISSDVGAAVAYLRSPDGGACTSVFTVGFCFGGAQSWLQAANGHGLAGVIGFYGRPGPVRGGAPGPAARAAEFACPVLALMGGADEGIPPEQVDELRTAFQAADLDHKIVVYPGAPHSFFDRHAEQYANASSDAWRRMLFFIAQYSAKRAPAAAG